MEQNQFRIGGCYRDRAGSVVRLVDGSGLPDFMRDDYVGTVAARCVYATYGMGYGFRRLDNGMLGSAQHIEDHHAHLIPGEVTERGEPIEAAPETLESLVAQITPENRHEEAWSADPKRAPLPYFTERAQFDPFKGFVTTSRTTNQPAQRSFGRFVSPDMQDNGPQVAPGFGSAALVVKE